MEWIDETKSYKSDEEVSSTAKYGQFKIHIHRHIHYEKDDWLASCYGLFELRVMKSKNLDEAKCQAKAILQAILEDAINDMLPKKD